MFQKGQRVIVLSNSYHAPNRFTGKQGTICEIFSRNTIDVNFPEGHLFSYHPSDLSPIWCPTRRFDYIDRNEWGNLESCNTCSNQLSCLATTSGRIP